WRRLPPACFLPGPPTRRTMDRFGSSFLLVPDSHELKPPWERRPQRRGASESGRPRLLLRAKTRDHDGLDVEGQNSFLLQPVVRFCDCLLQPLHLVLRVHPLALLDERYEVFEFQHPSIPPIDLLGP